MTLCLPAHRKSHMKWSVIEPVSLLTGGSDQPPQPWHGLYRLTQHPLDTRGIECEVTFAPRGIKPSRCATKCLYLRLRSFSNIRHRSGNTTTKCARIQHRGSSGRNSSRIPSSVSSRKTKKVSIGTSQSAMLRSRDVATNRGKCKPARNVSVLHPGSSASANTKT